MEDVIKHIIHIDQKAYDKKLQTERQILQQDKDFENVIKVLTEEIITTARQDAEQAYAKAIENQTNKINTIKTQTSKDIKIIGSKYQEEEEEICNKLFKQIFSMEEYYG